MTEVLSPATVQKLAQSQPATPVLSAHLNTDPRDPINTSAQPAWQIELRNGLAEVGDQIEEQGDRDTILAFRDFRGDFEHRVAELVRTHAGRSLAVFTTLDGHFDEVVISQLPLRTSVVRWDERPYVRPLWELADRGRPLGVVAIDGDEVVGYRWSDGRLEPLPEISNDLDGWRDDLPGDGGRGPRFRSHEQQMDARADQHGRRFLLSSGEQVASELTRLGAAGLVLVAAPGTAADFIEGLGQAGREQIVATADAHLTGVDPHELNERLEDTFEQVWRERGKALVTQALALDGAGGSAAIGSKDVLEALTEHRVEHLVASPELQVTGDQVGELARDWADHVPDHLLAERLLEHAVETGVEISILPGHQPLVDAGGVVATLRW